MTGEPILTLTSLFPVEQLQELLRFETTANWNLLSTPVTSLPIMLSVTSLVVMSFLLLDHR